MASTYNNLKIEIPATGEQSGLWGATTNQNMDAIQQAIGGQVTVSFASDADKTLAYLNTNASQDFRAMYLNVTSAVSLTVTRSLIVPAVNKLYVIKNATTGGKSITVKIGASTGTTVNNGDTVILYANGTDVVIAAIGLNYIDEGQTLDSNSTATQYLAATGGTDIDGTLTTNLVLAPKGYGYLCSAIPDGTAVGGNVRGSGALDLQLQRGLASHVARGSNSVLFGNQNTIGIGGINAVITGGVYNTVSADSGVIAGGSSNTIHVGRNYGVISGGANNNVYQGNYAVICGGSYNTSAEYSTVAGGTYNAAGDYGRAGGSYASTKARNGSDVFASGSFSSTAGTAQCTESVLRTQTTNATATRLTSDGAVVDTTNTLNLADNSSLYIKGSCVARNTSTGDTKVWTFEGAIRRGANAGATALVASITPTAGAADAGASAWTLVVAADTTSGGLAVTATGAASATIRWVCRVDTTEVMNG